MGRNIFFPWASAEAAHSPQRTEEKDSREDREENNELEVTGYRQEGMVQRPFKDDEGGLQSDFSWNN